MALRELRINNIAVVADATLECSDGFTVLTGETGAGKSVCINALRAALGGRMDSDMIRHGADSARVVAVFDEISDSLRARLAELSVPEHDLLTMSREVARGGRSACRINGGLVSQSALREAGETIIEVTSQGASQRLLRRQWQRDVLDAAGGGDSRQAREDVDTAVRAWRAAVASLDQAQRTAHAAAEEIQRARDRIADVGPLELRAGEEDELQSECTRLRHAARIAEAALGLAAAATGEDLGGADLLAEAAARAAPLGAVDQSLHLLEEEATDLVVRLRDLALDAKRHAEAVSLDEARLAMVEARLDVLARVTRRYGSVEQALAELERAGEIAGGADGGHDRIRRLETAAAAARLEAGRAAAVLRDVRVAAARRLERAVTSELRGLELPHARFRVVITRAPDPDGVDLGDGAPVRCGLSGAEEIEFRLASGRDTVPRPLDDGPSGGELSRLALALASVVTEEAAPALVLDEVDTGIGGEAAARVGDVLAAIGEARQVIAVTHRPEIAARAQSHVLVTKRELPGGPSATAGCVDGEDRVVEVARLMSGRTTRAALTRAAELLEEGRGRRERGRRGVASVRTM
jgi:DNA repair protein RecN (Recombination protein N)